MSHALLAIQNILQNSNIFIGSRETVLFTPVGSKKVIQFSGLPSTSVSYLKVNRQRPTFVMRRSELKIPTLAKWLISPLVRVIIKNLQKDPCAQDQQQY